MQVLKEAQSQSASEQQAAFAKHFEEVNSEHRAKVDKLQRDLAAVELLLNQAESKFSAEKQQLQSAISLLEETNKAKIDKITDLQAHAESLGHKLASQKADSEAELREQDKRVEVLTGELSQASEKLTRQALRIEKLEQDSKASVATKHSLKGEHSKQLEKLNAQLA